MSIHERATKESRTIPTMIKEITQMEINSIEKDGDKVGVHIEH